MKGRGSPARRRATRLLLAVSEMHKRGFQGLRIVPWMDADPFAWHCHLVLGPCMDPGHGAHTHLEMGSTLPYTFADGDGYGGSHRSGSTARDIADELEHGSLSSWLSSARIDDFPYAGWYAKMLGMAERGYLPSAVWNGTVVPGDAPLPLFAWPDGTVPTAHHTLPPAPRPACTSSDGQLDRPESGPLRSSEPPTPA